MNDPAHLGDEIIVLIPFPFQGFEYRLFTLGGYDIDDDALALPEAIDTMNRLNKIIELVADAREYCAMAIALKISTLARNVRLRREIL